MTSPVTRALLRDQLRQRSTMAASQALFDAARMSSRPSERRDLARMGRRMESCAVTHRCWIETPAGEPSRLVVSNKRACRIRALCALCEYRRARALSSSLAALLPYIWDINDNARALFLTLTTRNRDFTEQGLAGMVGDHMPGLRRLFDLARIQEQTLGHYTAVEIAIRERNGTKKAGVHSHSIVIVDEASYFAGGLPAIHQTEWRDLWRKSARLNYAPIVDIRAAKTADGSVGLASAQSMACELLKYIVKPHNLFQHNSGAIHVDPAVVLTIARVLRRQRVTRFDRIFMEATKRRKQHLKIQANS